MFEVFYFGELRSLLHVRSLSTTPFTGPHGMYVKLKFIDEYEVSLLKLNEIR